MKESSRADWENFWDRGRELQEVYKDSERLVENLLKVVDVKGKKVLEVGAGTGRDGYHLIKAGAEVHFLDYADNSLKIIQQIARESKISVPMIQGDATMSPVQDESYDIIYHQGLMEHFHEPEHLVKENIRLLKKGGLLLIDVPQRYHIYTIIKHILIAMDKWFAGWETQFSIPQLKKMMANQGLEIVHVYGEWMYPSLFYRIFREIGLKLKIKLPLYPPKAPVLSQIRGLVRKSLKNNNLAKNTFLNIGIICRKKG